MATPILSSFPNTFWKLVTSYTLKLTELFNKKWDNMEAWCCSSVSLTIGGGWSSTFGMDQHSNLDLMVMMSTNLVLVNSSSIRSYPSICLYSYIGIFSLESCNFQGWMSVFWMKYDNDDTIFFICSSIIWQNGIFKCRIIMCRNHIMEVVLD
jgi:hypothetical protein